MNERGAGGAGGSGELRFHVGVEGGDVPLGCREVRGFHQAAAAARDPGAMPPARLILIGLDDAAMAWVSDWAEDSERVRRTMTFRRLLDDVELTAVATLASFGWGVETALAVESVSAVADDGLQAALLRSGVHPKAMIEAALELGAFAPAESDDAGWFVHR